MIVTTKFVKKIQRSTKRKLYQFISSEKGLNCALLAAKFGVQIIEVRIIEVRIIEVRIIEDALYCSILASEYY